MIKEFIKDYEFLSNFYPSKIPFRIMDGVWVMVPTVEHAFQASKSIDPPERQAIASATTPGQAKRLGRLTSLRPDWEEQKVNIMRELLMSKFADPILRDKLLETGDEELREGNWWHDNFWGDCYCEKCKAIKGSNMLGSLLMAERERIKNQQKGD